MPGYDEKFRIPDGDEIRVTAPDGESNDYECRYIDDYHLELNGTCHSLYHIAEFAERMERNGNTVIPLRSPLPEFCHNVNVVIANPKWVSAVKGNKDDKKDSKWIGDLFRMELVPKSYIPIKNIRILLEFTRYHSKLVSMRSSGKNHFQNAFTMCNLMLDAVVSDMFGMSATAI